MSKTVLKLNQIQSKLNAPKNLENKFGNYRYRSAESILEALKPHLEEHQAILTLSDDIVEVGGRVYVKATATFSSDGEKICTTAFARETETKKGMDDAQVTGSCSSYARKYALNGLFCIDDTKDADATNDHDKAHSPAKVVTANKPTAVTAPAKANDDMLATIEKVIRSQTTLSDLDAKMDKAKGTPHGNNPLIIKAYNETKTKINQ